MSPKFCCWTNPAGLDPIMTNVINDLILENVRELGATVVSITSNLDGARHRRPDHHDERGRNGLGGDVGGSE